jgi:hypothetical protein
MFNGSFGSIREFLPVIGYDADKELSENRKRSEQGLPKLTSRMAATNDSLASRQDAYAPDALWVNGTLTIGTDAGQTAVAPGQLTRQWEKAGRRYFRYEIAQPAPFDWHVGTGRYASSVVNGKGVQTTVLYDPKHRYNIAYYQTILHKAVAFINQHLGDYPYRQVRMVEIPFYQKKFYAFPNTIAVSEKEGWLADTSGLQEKAFLHLSVASQVFAHWAQANIPVANVQGADMLRVALPEALALRFVQEQLGVKATDLLVEKKRNLYGKERNNEANREPALLYADGADYLEINKGAIALYHAMQSVGAAKFASLVRQFDPKNPRDYQTFLSFYNKLKPGLQPAGQAAFVRVY